MIEMSMTYFLGFLRHIVPMILTIAGFCLFTVRREGCEKKFFLTILVTVALEYVIYYFMLAGDAGVQGDAISKTLTIIMISLQIFWGGLYVYGGWSRIGIYIFTTDMILGITDRLYWTTWQYFSHRPLERDLIYFKDYSVYDPSMFFYYLVDFLIIIPILIGGYKLRNRPLRPAWLFKTAVIIYLVLGSTPMMSRPGFEGSFGYMAILVEAFWVLLFLLLLLTMYITVTRENQRILYIRRMVVAEQSQLLMLQKEKVRRLRHDLTKHLSNLEYILEKEPGLRTDSALLNYQEKLRTNVEWMKGEFFCGSSVLNLCFEQVKRYCDERGIVLDVILKRLNHAGWSQEDQLMFGMLQFNLLQVFGESRSIVAVHYAGDCLLGQNILRVTMAAGTDGGNAADIAAGTAPEIVGTATAAGQNKHGLADKAKDEKKNRKLVSNLEKDIQLVLSRYEGGLEREEHDDGLPVYVINWRDRSGSGKSD